MLNWTRVQVSHRECNSRRLWVGVPLQFGTENPIPSTVNGEMCEHGLIRNKNDKYEENIPLHMLKTIQSCVSTI